MCRPDPPRSGSRDREMINKTARDRMTAACDLSQVATKADVSALTQTVSKIQGQLTGLYCCMKPLETTSNGNH